MSKIRDSIAVSKVLLDQIEESVDYNAGKNASACSGNKDIRQRRSEETAYRSDSRCSG